jgi:hypothetical protein
MQPEPQEDRTETVAERLQKCFSCPSLTDLSVCRKCGCYMPVKALFKGVSCPDGRW